MTKMRDTCLRCSVLQTDTKVDSKAKGADWPHPGSIARMIGEIYLELNYSEDESEGSRLATPWLDYPDGDGETYSELNFSITEGRVILQGAVMSRRACKAAVAFLIRDHCCTFDASA